MREIYLVEPPSDGLPTGGYVYNERMSAHVAGLTRHSLLPTDVPAWLDAHANRTGSLLLLDSLWLAQPAWFGALLQGKRRGLRTGLLLHAFPSFIERARRTTRASQLVTLQPTPEELGLVAQLDIVVTPGQYLACLLKRLGCQVPCIICPPGVAHAARVSRDPLSTSAPHALLSVGPVAAHKGFLDALRALARLKQHAWHWSIIGRTEADVAYTDRMRQLITEHDLTLRVRLLGPSNHERTLEHIAHSDLLLLPSYTENAPLVAYEALAAGVPVIAYDVGGISEIVAHGSTGLLAKLGDAVALERALHSVLSNSLLYQRLKSAAESCQLPSWRRAALQFAERIQRPYSRAS